MPPLPLTPSPRLIRAAVIFVYNKHNPRVSRVVFIATGILTLMFSAAAINTYLKPSPATCSVYSDTTEVGSLLPCPFGLAGPGPNLNPGLSPNPIGYPDLP